jgi:hypothetical protein
MGGWEGRFPGWMLIVSEDRRFSSRCWKKRSPFAGEHRVFIEEKMPMASVNTATMPLIQTSLCLATPYYSLMGKVRVIRV